MKTKIYLIYFLSILLASCSSLQQSTVNDDIYYSPKDELIASNDVYDHPTSKKSQSTIFGDKYDKEISDILEDDTKAEIDTVIYESDEEYENPYESIVVDSYDESYERRMEAMRSPYGGISNNYFITFSDDYWYAQAYFNDPYYNVIIMGDQIWVEPYWMSSWYYRPSWSYYYGYGYPYYYSSFYYRPYYYSYYNGYYNPYYYGHYSHYPNYNHYNNDNYAGSSFHSYRQRTLAGTTRNGTAVGRASRDLPETYMARDVRSSSTVKSGIDRQSGRTVRTGDASNVTRSREISETGNTVRVREANGQRTNTTVRTTSSGGSGTSRNYTRPKQTTRSTYSSPSRTATRYNRPESTSRSSGSGSSGTTRTSTYSPNRSSTTRSGSGSSYTPTRSTRSSGSSGSSNRSSGSVRSSGSSGSSGSSSRSSGSSGSSRSSGSSSSSSRGRR
ncbi:hypothetical protein ACFLSE_10440 [Bacteroidota bacterium]